MDLEIDTTAQGWGPVLTHDSKGLALDRIRLIERLMLAEITWIYLEWRMDRKVAEPLLKTLIHGFKGYENYTDQELVDEWAHVDGSFYQAHDRGELFYAPPPFDPLHQWAARELASGPAADPLTKQ